MSNTDNYNYKCVLNSGENNCKEVVQSEWEKEYFNYRKLKSVITDEYCEDLETSNDSKYKCILNEEGAGCEEMDNSNYLKFTITLISCLLLFVKNKIS